MRRKLLTEMNKVVTIWIANKTNEMSDLKNFARRVEHEFNEEWRKFRAVVTIYVHPYSISGSERPVRAPFKKMLTWAGENRGVTGDALGWIEERSKEAELAPHPYCITDLPVVTMTEEDLKKEVARSQAHTHCYGGAVDFAMNQFSVDHIAAKRGQ